jgi:hypothetical protein
MFWIAENTWLGCVSVAEAREGMRRETREKRETRDRRMEQGGIEGNV